MCTRIVDIVPKRVCITQLLPASSCPPPLQLSHAAIRLQLVAHSGLALARVLEEQRLAAACTCSFVALRDLVQQVGVDTGSGVCLHGTAPFSLRALHPPPQPPCPCAHAPIPACADVWAQ